LNQLISPQIVLLAALLTALVSVAVGFRSNRRSLALLKQREAWPAFVESVISGLSAGLSRIEAVALAIQASPAVLQRPLSRFRMKLNDSRLRDALPALKDSMADSFVDEFAELLRLNELLGGVGLVPVLKEHAKRCRTANIANSQVRVKSSATMSMARLSVAAPWILLALLLSRSESEASFASSQGLGVLLFGLLVCFLAYRLIGSLGRSKAEVRVYG
jgi:tight adherence protein B